MRRWLKQTWFLIHEWAILKLVQRIGQHRAAGYRLLYSTIPTTARSQLRRRYGYHDLTHYDGVLALGL